MIVLFDVLTFQEKRLFTQLEFPEGIMLAKLAN